MQWVVHAWTPATTHWAPGRASRPSSRIPFVFAPLQPSLLALFSVGFESEGRLPIPRYGYLYSWDSDDDTRPSSYPIPGQPERPYLGTHGQSFPIPPKNSSPPATRGRPACRVDFVPDMTSASRVRVSSRRLCHSLTARVV